MEPDEILNNSAFSNSFSAYSEHDSSTISNVEAENNRSDSKSCNDSPMTAAMNHKIKNKVPFSGIIGVAELLNQNNSIVRIPNNSASLKKNSSMRFDREFIMICKCKKLCDESGECRLCKCITKKNKSNFVVKIAIKQQIKYLVHKYFPDILSYKNREKEKCSISDIDDGLLFTKLSNENPDCMLLTFTINSDGAPIYNSSNKSMWPIQLYANFLPPKIRFNKENILLYMLYVSKEKPDFKELFYHLAKEINELQEQKMAFFYNEKIFTCIPIIMLGAFDLPARAMASSLKQYSGQKSCVFCLHPGKQIVDRNGQKYIRYVRTNEEIESRTHHGVISAITKMGTKDKYGLTDIPPMALFKSFDLTNGYSIDYMHNIVLGVTKLLINLWMGDHRATKKKAPILPKNRNTLNQRIVKLKPCSYITRKPRSLQERSNFKAIEYKNMLLFYLNKFSLNALLDNEKVKHFEHLSAATYTLLKTKISEREIIEASEMLEQFANKFEELYGEESVTMNVHMLRHYGSTVFQCGPLWGHSMFAFEKNIGTLKKSIHNPTDALDNITFDYCLKRKESQPISVENIAKMNRTVSLTLKEKEILLQNDLISSTDEVFLSIEMSDSISLNDRVFK